MSFVFKITRSNGVRVRFKVRHYVFVNKFLFRLFLEWVIDVRIKVAIRLGSVEVCDQSFHYSVSFFPNVSSRCTG